MDGTLDTGAGLLGVLGLATLDGPGSIVNLQGREG
jgi:hypothetical protein